MLAHQFGYQLIQKNIASLMKGSIGGTEEEIVKLFQQAKKQAPCFLVLDEFTSIFRKHDKDEDENHGNNNSHNDSSTEKTIFSTLLSRLDDVNAWNLYNSSRIKDERGGDHTTSKGDDDYRKRNIIVIGITREPWLIPNRLLSNDRFQRSILVDLLGKEDREKFLRTELGLATREEDEALRPQWEELLRLTEGYSGADIRYLLKRLDNLQHRMKSEEKLKTIEVLQALIAIAGQRKPSVPQSLLEKFKRWKR